MYLAESKKMLSAEYQKRSVLIADDYQREFMLEKIRHSYQVLGAGNFLLKHERCFADLSEDRKDYLQAIVLLHDIGRFFEILEIRQGRRVDHGAYGAQYLTAFKDFNDMDALLPIKHHGHLIECLFEDDDFKMLSEQKQKEVLKISFLVRDADKLANFYLLSHEYGTMEKVFFVENCFDNPYSQEIGDEVWKDFTMCQCINRKNIHNFAEHALFFLAWIFDLHYQYSFVFLKKLNILEKLITQFSKFWTMEQTQNIKDVVLKYQKLKNKNL